MASGPAVRAGVAIDEVSITDIAPLLLYALDLPVPDDMAGVIPAAVFGDDHFAARPARYVAAADRAATAAAGDDGAALFDDEDEATILSRLRALGYVE
jgi:hypothetical protein